MVWSEYVTLCDLMWVLLPPSKLHTLEAPLVFWYCLHKIGKSCKSILNFRWRRWGSLVPGLRTLDPPLSPSSTPAEIFQCMCLQSHLQTSPTNPQKSYLTRTTFENTMSPWVFLTGKNMKDYWSNHMRLPALEISISPMKKKSYSLCTQVSV